MAFPLPGVMGLYAGDMRSVGDLVQQLDAWFPAHLAEEWDAVGLLTGRRADRVERVALAVDVTEATVAWAIAQGAQLLVVHHPLYLRGTNQVDGDSPSGALIHDAIRHGLAIVVAHTNADRARPGVSDALADAFGVLDTVPMVPSAHDPRLGLGRVGHLASPKSLVDFVAEVARVVPSSASGVRWAGDGARLVQRVAICGGSGADLLDAVDADVYVTSDLRHHVALDYLATDRAALVDIAHAAAEWMWLEPLAQRLCSALPDVTATVCPIITDPWAGAIPS